MCRKKKAIKSTAVCSSQLNTKHLWHLCNRWDMQHLFHTVKLYTFCCSLPCILNPPTTNLNLHFQYFYDWDDAGRAWNTHGHLHMHKKLWIHQQMRTVIIHSSDLHVDVQFSFNWQLTAAIMTLTIREIGRCWKEVGEQSRGPVSLGINLATGSTNRLSPPISRQRTDSYLYCQVAAAAAPQKREDSSKKLRRIGTPVKQNAMQQDTFGCLETSEAFASTDFT